MVKFLENNNSGFNQWIAAKNASAGGGKRRGGFFWWIVIILLAWWLFSTWLSPKTENTVADSGAGTPEDLSKVPEFEMVGEKISFDVKGLRVSQIDLKDYRENKYEEKPISLLTGENNFIESGLIANGTTAPNSGTAWKVLGDGRLSWKNADGVEFIRTITVENDYVVRISDEVKNNSGRDVAFTPYVRVARDVTEASTGVASGGIAFVNGEVERENWKAVSKEAFAYTTGTGFVGFEEQYWQTVVSINSDDQTIKLKPLADGRVQAEAGGVSVPVPAASVKTFETTIFAGPKTSPALTSAAALITGIDQTIDYGWFWFLAQPFTWGLNALHDIVHNYGLAIIFLTIFIRILIWPLTRKSFASMATMQKMQPEIQRVQKLYGNDKLRMQQELMAVYKNHKASPMAGFGVMLLQIPIFFALYKALLIAVPMRHANFLWISDLSVMDPYFILPIIMGATMWWQQRMQSPKTSGDKNDPMAQTQKMMKWMPAIFTVLFVWMPAGLVLYWTVSNLFGIGQLYWMKRKG